MRGMAQAIPRFSLARPQQARSAIPLIRPASQGTFSRKGRRRRVSITHGPHPEERPLARLEGRTTASRSSSLPIAGRLGIFAIDIMSP
jgi:hypothetical protein